MYDVSVTWYLLIDRVLLASPEKEPLTESVNVSLLDDDNETVMVDD